MARCQLQRLATTYMFTFPLLLGLLSKHPSCKASQKCCMQGRTDRLDPLPQEMLHSQVMLLAPNGVTMFLSSYEKHTVSWHISWQAPQSLAAELNAKLQDPTTAQVGWQVLDSRQIMTLRNRHIMTLQQLCFKFASTLHHFTSRYINLHHFASLLWLLINTTVQGSFLTADPDCLFDLLLLVPLLVLFACNISSFPTFF